MEKETVSRSDPSLEFLASLQKKAQCYQERKKDANSQKKLLFFSPEAVRFQVFLAFVLKAADLCGGVVYTASADSDGWKLELSYRLSRKQSNWDFLKKVCTSHSSALRRVTLRYNDHKYTANSRVSISMVG